MAPMNDEKLDRSGGARWAVLLDRPEVSTRPAASRAKLNAAEVKLDTRLPPSLRELYLQTDGVWDPAGQWYVIWPLDDVVARNAGTVGERAGVAFGDDGTGNPFSSKQTAVSATGLRSTPSTHALRRIWSPFWTAWAHDDPPPTQPPVGESCRTAS